MVNRSFADMRRTPVSPAPCRAFFRAFDADFFSGLRKIHRGFIRATDHGGLCSVARLMNWLIIFLGVWPIALVVLLRFAARIDPSSGHWLGRQAATLAWRDAWRRYG